MIRDSRSFVSLCLATVVLAAAPAAAERVSFAYQGAGVATEIDLDDDGVTGIFVQGAGRGSLGKVTVHAVFDAALVATDECAAGEIQNDFVGATNVIQDRQGNQIFLGLIKGRLCANATFTGFTSTVREEILGGTGKYAGATGRVTTVCQGAFLALDLVPGGGRPAHSAFACEVSGRID